MEECVTTGIRQGHPLHACAGSPWCRSQPSQHDKTYPTNLSCKCFEQLQNHTYDLKADLRLHDTISETRSISHGKCDRRHTPKVIHSMPAVPHRKLLPLCMCATMCTHIHTVQAFPAATIPCHTMSQTYWTQADLLSSLIQNIQRGCPCRSLSWSIAATAACGENC